VAAAAIALIVLSLGNSVSYYLTVDEFNAQSHTLEDTRIRISGKVAPGTIVWDAVALSLEFTVSGNSSEVSMVYAGVPPEGFRDEANVLVDGQLGADGIFRAGEILMKCPSKYEPED
jgi:cytochrome c-type biogenesis protein CcmE